MSKFKVGDKVRAVCASHGWGFSVNKGDIGMVVSIPGYGGHLYYVDFPHHKTWHAIEGDLELVIEDIKVLEYTDNSKVKQLSVNKEIKGDNNMSLVSKVKQLSKNKDTRLLEEYGVISPQGSLTCEGQELLIEHLFETHKAEIVEKIKALDEEAKKKSKK